MEQQSDTVQQLDYLESHPILLSPVCYHTAETLINNIMISCLDLEPPLGGDVFHLHLGPSCHAHRGSGGVGRRGGVVVCHVACRGDGLRRAGAGIAVGGTWFPHGVTANRKVAQGRGVKIAHPKNRQILSQ